MSIPALFLIAALQTTAAQTAPPSPGLSGAWTVDLSVDPAQPYTQPMHLDLKPDGTVTGDFYNSDILAGRWKTQNGRTCVAFRTTDGAGPYHTSGCLVGDRVEGQTWAEHRNFVFVWNAARAAP